MAKEKVLIVDTKAGNLFSLQACIERLGYDSEILQSPKTENYLGDEYTAIVIPGQGRFGTVMKNISANGWPRYLKSAFEQQIPMLGICVGMQIFFTASEEDPEATGLAWFDGKARALEFPKKPMVGWANIETETWQDTCIYFVNSFAIQSAKESIATTFYGEKFCAAIRSGSFTGVQFHPEKSGESGSKIIAESLKNRGSDNE